MEIWLSSNLQAHPFIVPSYWAEHLEEVKRLIPQAEVYVHESDGVVNGFLGLTEAGNIAGLFISEQARGQGIGKRLLSKAKRLYSTLLLTVYEKNVRAVHFYQREGFHLVEKGRIQIQGKSNTGCDGKTLAFIRWKGERRWGQLSMLGKKTPCIV